MRAFHRTLAITLLACSPLFLPALAQTTVASTFGPGDSHSTIEGYIVNANQSLAQGFVYSGPAGYFLSQVRLVLAASETPYTVEFLTGADMNAATLLESWTTTPAATGIVPFASALNPALSIGETYWLAAFNGGSSVATGWYSNDQGYTGLTYQLNGSSWGECLSCLSGAYDVSAVAGVVATPEPASLALVATGLLAVLGIARRQKETRFS